MNFELIKFSADASREWDDFILSSPYGSVHQVSDWKKFQEKIPGRGPVMGWAVRETSKNGQPPCVPPSKKGGSNPILAATFCVFFDTGFLGKKWGYSARGPVFRSGLVGQRDSGIAKVAGQFLVSEVSKILKKEGAMFWRMDPYEEKGESPFLKGDPQRGGGFSMRRATQNYQPENTLEIDLTQTEEAILAAMKRKGRYNINLARKKGVEIKAFSFGKKFNLPEPTKKETEAFWELNNETTDRDGFSGHGRHYYEHFLKDLSEYSVLFLAEFEGKRVATAISTFCGPKSIYYFGASTSDSDLRKIMAPYLLQWEMMRFGKAQGCTSYDFLGVAPAVDEQNYEKTHAYAGITEIKLNFGGQRKDYAGGREVVFDPFWYALYRGVKRFW